MHISHRRVGSQRKTSSNAVNKDYDEMAKAKATRHARVRGRRRSSRLIHTAQSAIVPRRSSKYQAIPASESEALQLKTLLEVKDEDTDVLRDFNISNLDTEALVRSKAVESCGTVRLRIGGTEHMILAKNFLRFPASRLRAIAYPTDPSVAVEDLCDRYDIETKTCVFQRNAEFGHWMLDFYRSGHLHIPRHFCSDKILQEMEYWQLNHRWIPCCCLHKMGESVDDDVVNAREGIGLAEDAQAPTDAMEFLQEKDDMFHGICCGNSRRKLWSFFEDPASSISALVFMFVSLSFIILTVVALMLSSIRSFQVYSSELERFEPIATLQVIDTIVVGWFTFEYVARLLITPQRQLYARNVMSIIDVLAVSPFYIELVISKILGHTSKDMQDFKRSFVLMRILRVLRVMRVVRVLKVARYSKGMQSMGTTIKRSWRELLMMVFFMITSNLMFSTAMYYVENDEPDTLFVSIPAASWWCIITMTTVGYGDLTPATPLGKLIASAAAITGIVILAFPISIVVQNFDDSYCELRSEPTEDDQTTVLESLRDSQPYA